ncbi:hypothetical protein DV515_00019329, partial [Chloebia gouldiae]
RAEPLLPRRAGWGCRGRRIEAGSGPEPGPASPRAGRAAPARSRRGSVPVLAAAAGSRGRAGAGTPSAPPLPQRRLRPRGRTRNRPAVPAGCRAPPRPGSPAAAALPCEQQRRIPAGAPPDERGCGAAAGSSRSAGAKALLLLLQLPAGAHSCSACSANTCQLRPDALLPLHIEHRILAFSAPCSKCQGHDKGPGWDGNDCCQPGLLFWPRGLGGVSLSLPAVFLGVPSCRAGEGQKPLEGKQHLLSLGCAGEKLCLHCGSLARGCSDQAWKDAWPKSPRSSWLYLGMEAQAACRAAQTAIPGSEIPHSCQICAEVMENSQVGRDVHLFPEGKGHAEATAEALKGAELVQGEMFCLSTGKECIQPLPSSLEPLLVPDTAGVKVAALHGNFHSPRGTVRLFQQEFGREFGALEEQSKCQGRSSCPSPAAEQEGREQGWEMRLLECHLEQLNTSQGRSLLAGLCQGHGEGVQTQKKPTAHGVNDPSRETQ